MRGFSGDIQKVARLLLGVCHGCWGSQVKTYSEVFTNKAQCIFALSCFVFVFVMFLLLFCF